MWIEVIVKSECSSFPAKYVGGCFGLGRLVTLQYRCNCYWLHPTTFDFMHMFPDVTICPETRPMSIFLTRSNSHGGVMKNIRFKSRLIIAIKNSRSFFTFQELGNCNKKKHKKELSVLCYLRRLWEDPRVGATSRPMTFRSRAFVILFSFEQRKIVVDPSLDPSGRSKWHGPLN